MMGGKYILGVPIPLMIMIMTRPESLNSLPLLAAIAFLLCSSRPRFCMAQSNPCETYGKCGPFGLCSPRDSPICTCLQGFYPRNDREWSSGNWTSGCLRRSSLSCEGSNGGKEDGFLKLQMMNLSGYSDRWFGPEILCGDRCLSNCSCLAYGFQVGNGCVFWSGTLIDLQKSPTGPGSDLYIRLSSSETDRKKDSKKIIIIVVVVVGFVIISVFTYFSWKWIAKLRGKKKTTQLTRAGASTTPVDTPLQNALNQVNLEEFPSFKFEILANATNNFSEANKLGKGGFGSVYKGELANGREIAVKRLSQASRQGAQEFMNEVVLISKLQHRNLVRLLGCCVENRETMLIYEYMPNKSLDFYLFDSRFKIIHRDLKPSNVLLDNDWNPKISDFGMARMFGTQQDHVSTVRVVGTYGYMPPEYAIKGRFSEKSDVFSFGVLVLEIATGRRNRSFYYQDDSMNLLGHVWKLWNEDSVADLMDPRISSSSFRAEVMRCVHIGLLCVQELPKDRPSMSAVLSMLSSEIVELPEPKQSAFAVKSSGSDTGSSSSQQSQKPSFSINNVTLTTVHGR